VNNHDAPTAGALLSLQNVGSIILLAGAYFITAQLGFSLVSSASHVEAIWPPYGVALAALLLLGLRVWPGVFLGALIAALGHGDPSGSAVCIALAATLAALIGTLLLRRLQFDLAIERSRDVVYLISVAGASTLISPTLGATSLAVYGRASWNALPSIWWEWWAADCLGILLVAPLLLTWLHKPRLSGERTQLIGFIAFITTVLLVCKFAFANPANSVEPRYLLLSTAFPLLIWGALQFGPRETILCAVILSIAAAWSWIHGRVPYPEGVVDRPLLVIDIFIGEIIGTALLLGSITSQRRRAYDEMELRVAERTAELANRNEEKEILLREIHHRVKNNMQVICSLLNLQAHRFGDWRLVGAFADSQYRIKSMALVHEHLYQSTNLDRISMDTYIRALVEGIASTQLPGNNVRFEVSAGELTLPIDTAVPCGLIINEMVTNAFKYAFPAGRLGRLDISMTEPTGDSVELVVSDDGVGLPPEHRSPGDPSFGMSLVWMLAEQLNATLEVLPTPGTTFRLLFSRTMAA
jgi:two-component sensor histidine kinase/integral membrane sensor domain MASE1